MRAAIAPQFVISVDQFLESEGFASLAAARESLGDLDEWARDHGVFCFSALIYKNYGGTITNLNEDQADNLFDAVQTMPWEALSIIQEFPQLLNGTDLRAASQLLDRIIGGQTAEPYPMQEVVNAMSKVIVEASHRPSFVWQGLELSNVVPGEIDLSGAIIANVNLPLDKITEAKAFEGCDFRGVNIKGFNPSGRSLKRAIMPEDANSPRLFRWTTGIRPSEGTTWVDGTRPWG